MYISSILFLLIGNYVQVSWGHDPVVVVCNSSIFSVNEVEEEIRVWKDLDEDIDDVISLSCSNISAPANGFILVDSDPSKLKKSDLGYTETYRVGSQIVSANISIITDNKEILSHEIGHALGYVHKSGCGSIMSKIPECIERDYSGIEKRKVRVKK